MKVAVNRALASPASLGISRSGTRSNRTGTEPMPEWKVPGPRFRLREPLKAHPCCPWTLYRRRLPYLRSAPRRGGRGRHHRKGRRFEGAALRNSPKTGKSIQIVVKFREPAWRPASSSVAKRNLVKKDVAGRGARLTLSGTPVGGLSVDAVHRGRSC